jgi:hypothetical protein
MTFFFRRERSPRIPCKSQFERSIQVSDKSKREMRFLVFMGKSRNQETQYSASLKSMTEFSFFGCSWLEHPLRMFLRPDHNNIATK